MDFVAQQINLSKKVRCIHWVVFMATLVTQVQKFVLYLTDDR